MGDQSPIRNDQVQQEDVGLLQAESAQAYKELQDLEIRLIWELETWKKGEEAIFQDKLREKEADFLRNLQEKWKQTERQKESEFKAVEHSIKGIETRLKDKAKELQIREQKLILYEEELKAKASEIARNIQFKDAEILNLQKREKQNLSQYETQKLEQTTKYQELQSQLTKLQAEYDHYKQQQEKAPLNMYKQEIERKNRQIVDLEDKLRQADEIKSYQKQIYEKLRADYVKQKEALEELTINQPKVRPEDLEGLKRDLRDIIRDQEQQQNEKLRELKADLISADPKKKESKVQNRGKVSKFDSSGTSISLTDVEMNDDVPAYHLDSKDLSGIEKVIKTRDYLLSYCHYRQDDPLIVKLNEDIRNLQY